MALLFKGNNREPGHVPLTGTNPSLQSLSLAAAEPQV